MLNKHGEISPLQQTVQERLASRGERPGRLVTLTVRSTATGAAEQLMVPISHHTTVTDLLSALVAADKEATFFPPGVQLEHLAAVRVRNNTPLDRLSPLHRYNLQPHETIEIRCSGRRLDRATPTPPVHAAGNVCPICGYDLIPNANFCDGCGTPVERQRRPPQGHLVLQSTGARIPLPQDKREITVGRLDPESGSAPDIDLTSWDPGGYISRRHARFLIQEDQVLIEDLESTNYTFVNRRKLPPHQPQPIADGAEIRLGAVKLTFTTRP